MSKPQEQQFTIEPAQREGIKLLVGLFGKSGGGKTRTALMLARGIVGPEGRITLIDTERKRGSIFVDLIPGGYNVINFDEPFTPERYAEALKQAEAQSDIVVIDSMTHEWNGEGGVLEMQEAELDRMCGDDWKKRDARKMAAWIQPKMRHNRFVRALLRSALPVICCLRGKDKTHMEKETDRNGKEKTVVVTDDFSSPIYDADFIYELLICGEIYQQDGKGGYFRPEKITHPDVAGMIPGRDRQWTIEHGARLAQWAAGGSKQPQANSAPMGEAKKLKRAIWNAVKAHFKDDDQAFKQELWDEGIMTDSESLDDLPLDRLKEVLEKASAKWGSKVPGEMF